MPFVVPHPPVASVHPEHPVDATVFFEHMHRVVSVEDISVLLDSGPWQSRVEEILGEGVGLRRAHAHFCRRMPPHPHAGPPIIPPPIIPIPIVPYLEFHIMFGPGSGTTAPVHFVDQQLECPSARVFSLTSASSGQASVATSWRRPSVKQVLHL